MLISHMFPIYNSSDELNPARVLLTELRGGDYAHAGDKEAVTIVIQKALELSPSIREGITLDVGCGFGGTANDLFAAGFNKIWGIDLDPATVQYAREHYPRIQFVSANAFDVEKLFEPDFFSFFCLFNVLYAVEDKRDLLSKLADVAKPGALLAIFDYTAPDEILKLRDLGDTEMFFLNIKHLKDDLEASGWELLEMTDLSSRFVQWYRDILKKLSAKRKILSKKVSKEHIARVESTFKILLELLEEKTVGGAVIYARRMLEKRHRNVDGQYRLC